jgi:adenylate cyclase
MEIERKFLVNSLPANLKRGSGSEIRQGYFSLSSRGVEIRLRRKDSRHFLTVKSGRGRVRLEEEIPISKKRFENLWPLVKNACVLKRRFEVPFAGRTIELDVYRGGIAG